MQKEKIDMNCFYQTVAYNSNKYYTKKGVMIKRDAIQEKDKIWKQKEKLKERKCTMKDNIKIILQET